MSITVKDVRQAFNAAVVTARAAGLDAEHWVLQEGSRSGGYAYRIYKRSPEHGGLESIGCDNYLGNTAREAYQTLRGFASGLSLIAYPIATSA